MAETLTRGTTVLVVRKADQVVMAGDGQVTLGDTIVKHQARKVRRMYHDQILAGFAGSTADAFTLFAKLNGFDPSASVTFSIPDVPKQRFHGFQPVRARWRVPCGLRVRPRSFYAVRRIVSSRSGPVEM